MPRYQINGLDAAGKPVVRQILAASREEAGRLALEQEILIQKIEAVGQGSYRVPAAEKLNFIRLLSVTTGSGLPLLEGLRTILSERSKSQMGNVIMQMMGELEQGHSLSQSMAARGGMFNDLSISMVRAGEASGRLPETLKQLYEYESSAFRFRKKLVGALAYPAVVFTFSILVVILFMGFIVPRFRDTYASFHGKLPAITLILLNISSLVSDNLFIIMVLLIGGISGIIISWRSPVYKGRMEKLWMKFPVFGEMYYFGILTRFARTMGTLAQNQVNFLEALQLATDATESSWFSSGMKRVIADVRDGTSVSESFARAGLFPELGQQMLRMGEKSGKLGDLLVSMADFYQENLDFKVAGIETILQPVVIIGLGGFIGFLVLSLFLPMFDLPGVFK